MDFQQKLVLAKDEVGHRTEARPGGGGGLMDGVHGQPRKRFLMTKSQFSLRSRSRRLKYGSQCVPYGT